MESTGATGSTENTTAQQTDEEKAKAIVDKIFAKYDADEN